MSEEKQLSQIQKRIAARRDNRRQWERLKADGCSLDNEVNHGTDKHGNDYTIIVQDGRIIETQRSSKFPDGPIIPYEEALKTLSHIFRDKPNEFTLDAALNKLEEPIEEYRETQKLERVL